MSCSSCSSILTFLPILLTSAAAPTNYADILESQLIDHQLRALGPEGLLKSSRRQHERAVNRTCARDLKIYERAIDQRQSWALQMLDASSKLPVGMLQGHVIDMGMFDECMEARARSSDFDIRGRHCMYAIDSTPDKRFIVSPTLSICLPASCDAGDVRGLLDHTINANERLQSLGINVVSASCTAIASNHASTTFIICFAIATLYISFLLLCTICDLVQRKLKKDPASCKLVRTLERFSLLRNAEAILRANAPDGNLPVIHGIRAISTCWIVLVHEYLVQFLGVNVNVVYITKWFSSWGSMFPLVGVFSVDTFLALSGFLMAYNFFKQIRRTNEFNVPLYYLHRFIRLTFPLVAFIVATYVLIPGLGSGARYEWLQNIFVTGCASKWWSVLLYFQNFVQTDNYCLLHLWSLSVDMQLYWLSPLILYPLHKRPRFGLALLIFLTLASAISSASIVGAHGYSSIYFSHDYNITRVMEAFQNVYQMTYTRASPWLIGILFAYLVTHKSRDVVPNKAFVSMGWLMTIACFTFCTLGTRSFTHANYEYNQNREMIFAGLQRPLWAFGICWIIYASIHNVAGPIASILSAKMFVPISRISYSIYLVHIVLPVFQVGTSRAPKYFNQYSILQSFISDMVLAIIIAFFFSLAFEIPMTIMEELVFKRKQVTAGEATRKIE